MSDVAFRAGSRLAVVLLVFVAGIATGGGEEKLSPGQLVRHLKASAPPAPEVWVQAVQALADPAARDRVRGALLGRAPFPRKELVDLLDDRRLAVRLGALDILEEVGGGVMGFNPWVEPGTDPRNAGALRRWEAWAAGDEELEKDVEVLTGEQIQSYLRDLLSDERERAGRALRMLEPRGLAGVKAIQDFLHVHPDLPVGERARLKEAQYYLVLVRAVRDSAAVWSRDLVLGNRDQQLAALAALKTAGLSAIPIVRDYLDSPDPLVRETAIDSLLSLGGKGILGVAEPILAREKDINVIHSAIRRLRDIKSPKSIRLIEPFLDHEDEDLVISAIQALGSLGGSDSSMRRRRSSSGEEAGVPSGIDAKIAALLRDGRWRIKAAALEYVERRRPAAAAEAVVALLEDPDEFVRYRAVKAAVAMGRRDAIRKMKSMFLADDAMIGPVASAYSSLGRGFDDEMLAHLAGRSPDTIVTALRVLESTKPPVLRVLAYFAGHDDLDVSCAALRQLAADDDTLDHDEFASVVLGGLRSGVPEKVGSILESLRLRLKPGRIDPAVWALVTGGGQPGEPTSLDPLYDAFLMAGGGKKPALPPPGRGRAPARTVAAAKLEIVDELRKLLEEGGEHSYRVAYHLVMAGDSAGAKWFQGRLQNLSTAQRAALAEGLWSPANADLGPVLRTLMRDPVEEIRRGAASSAFYSRGNPVLVKIGLEEILDPAQPLGPHEAYGYRLENCAMERRMRAVISSWAREVLADEDAPNPVQVLGLILLRHNLRLPDQETVERFTQSADQWERRAAWYALAAGRPVSFRRNLDQLVADPSPMVRAVLPETVNRAPSVWKHQFDDLHSTDEHGSDYRRRERRLNSATREALEKMAESDSSDRIRFEALFALLTHGRTINLDQLMALIPAQPEEARVPYRLADYLESNASRVGPGLRPLLAHADLKSIDEDDLQTLLSRLAGPAGESGFHSFEALVETSATDAPQHVGDLGDEVEAAPRNALNVVFFFTPGCQECARVTSWLSDLKIDFPLLTVVRENITEADSTLLNQALCERFGAPSGRAGVVPAVFAQGGFLVHHDVNPRELGRLLARTMDLPLDEGWFRIAEEELVSARAEVERRFDALTLPLVLGAGLVDGVNPCAFATIIFFLSYLQVARRSPREILMVGATFILAVFLTYLAAGLVLNQVIGQVLERTSEQYAWVRAALTWAFAAFAGVVAVLSFRDGLRARRGDLEGMTLQLPGFLKGRIRTVIRKGARARNFLCAAFVAGILISFLELACTGQVYVPIIFKVQQGNADAVALLVLYNLAFVTPLIVVFALAYGGMTSDALIRFQKEHTAAVKFSLAALFLLLCLLLLLGHYIPTPEAPAAIR